MTELKWMERLCAFEFCHPAISKPFYRQTKDGVWRVATNSCLLVMVKVAPEEVIDAAESKGAPDISAYSEAQTREIWRGPLSRI